MYETNMFVKMFRFMIKWTCECRITLDENDYHDEIIIGGL